MKKYLLILLASSLIYSCNKKNMKEDVISNQVDSLMSKMTIDEKIGQLNQFNGSWDVTGPIMLDDEKNKKKAELLKKGMCGSMLNIYSTEHIRAAQKLAIDSSRLGIPMIFAADVIHGYKTIFPEPLAEAASFELGLMEKTARIAAIEASAAGLNWTFAPMVDIARDPRWGRVMEGAGEDTWYGGQVAKARIKGFQGDDLSEVSTIAACAKHFAAYGFAEGGRDYNTTDLSNWRLFNDVLPPFKASVEAGVQTVMSAFNVVLGVPSSGHNYLINQVLKDQWGFDGFVVSDWASISEMQAHGYAKDLEDAARLGLNGGVDMDMEGWAYINHTKELLEKGLITEETINNAVKRILTVKYRLGLFDDPYKYCNADREREMMKKPEYFDVAREIAEKSIVLLKNENNLLPLSKNTKTIAVIGPLADDKDSPLGNWRSQGEKNSAVSVLEAVKKGVNPSTKVLFAKGCDINKNLNDGFMEKTILNKTDRSGFPEAVSTAMKADVVVLCVGETAFMSGEARSKADITLPGVQSDLVKAIKNTGKPIVMLLFNGRPFDLSWESENLNAILNVWHLGQESGNAIANILFGIVNPSGKLPISFPRSVGQIPIYYNAYNTGRPYIDESSIFVSKYMDLPNGPLYPFGFGLSYSTFEYVSIKTDKITYSNNENIIVTVQVKNTSTIDGEEVVQLYIRDLVASTVRPIKELKAFKKLKIKAGELTEITFELTKEELSFYNADLAFVTEPGDFEVMAGGNSRDLIKTAFNIK